MIPAKPVNEQLRLATLRGYEILDTEPEAAFDDLTLLASYVCQTPVALISLIDADRYELRLELLSKCRVGSL